jgi:hypothetical protein
VTGRRFPAECIRYVVNIQHQSSRLRRSQNLKKRDRLLNYINHLYWRISLDEWLILISTLTLCQGKISPGPGSGTGNRPGGRRGNPSGRYCRLTGRGMHRERAPSKAYGVSRLFKSLSRTRYGMLRCKARKNRRARRICKYVEHACPGESRGGLQRNAADGLFSTAC